MGWSADLPPSFLKAVIEHVAHPIFVKDRKFRFVLVNRAFCEMVGYPRDEMLGRSDYDFFPAEQADFFRKKDMEMFGEGATVTIEEEPLTNREGEHHVLATTKVPYRDESGEVTHLVGIIHDITRLKAFEEELRRANDELEQRVLARTAELEEAQLRLIRKDRLEVLGQLAGGVAHQVRNPLGAIQNAVAVLRRDNSVGTRSTALEIIEEEVMRANRIITDLLDYARVSPPQLSRIELRPLVEELLAHEALPPTIALAFDVERDLFVKVDPVQVQTALGNVIRNAVEAMPDGGQLSIEARRGAMVEVRIRDTGEGVALDVREGLFLPLVTTKSTGVGLGLSTARNLLQNQGGNIDYEPSAAGTTFLIQLPAGD